jgi:hypothetical protein
MSNYGRTYIGRRGLVPGRVVLVTHRQLDQEHPRASVECLEYVLTKEWRWVRSQPGDNAKTLFDSEKDAERAFKAWLLLAIEKEVEDGDRTSGPQA